MCAKLAFVASSWLCGMHVKVFHTPKRKFDISFASKAHKPKGKRKRKELLVMTFFQNQTKFGIWVMLPGFARGAPFFSPWFYAEDSLLRRFSINDDNDDLRVHRQIVQTLTFFNGKLIVQHFVKTMNCLSASDILLGLNDYLAPPIVITCCGTLQAWVSREWWWRWGRKSTVRN